MESAGARPPVDPLASGRPLGGPTPPDEPEALGWYPNLPGSRGAQARLRRLRIRDFRNLAAVDLTPSPEGLALVGDNGQGKTNFLEAIYYVQLLRSFRGTRDQDLVRFGAAGFHLAAGVDGGRASEITIGFERTPSSRRGAGRTDASSTPAAGLDAVRTASARGHAPIGRAPHGRKRVRLDGAEPARLSDAIGAVPAVIWAPQDAVLVTGAPSERRRFLDVILSLTSRPYLHALQQYRGALANRNAALREAAQDAAADAVAVWEPALAAAGAVLWRARVAWTERHAEHFGELCRAIGERGAARMRYVSGISQSADPEEALLQALERKRALDIRRGLTHAGPHRDDLALTLSDVDGVGRDLRVYGSAGQQRTAAIGLRLLEAATLRAAAGCEPLVLLDDPFAELDTRRAGRILELLNAEGRGQTLLAVPRASDIPPGLTRLERWRIEGGRLSPERA